MVGVSTPDAGGDMKREVYDSNLDNRFGSDVMGIACEIAKMYAKVASNNLRHAIDAASTTEEQAWTKENTMTFTNGIKGTLRFKFTINRNDAGDAYGIMTKDGATPGGAGDLGIEIHKINAGDAIHAQDLAVDFAPGATIDIWGKRGTGGTGILLSLWRVYYDNATIPVAVASTGDD